MYTLETPIKKKRNASSVVNIAEFDDRHAGLEPPSLSNVLVVIDEQTRPSSLGIVRRLVDRFDCHVEVLCVSKEAQKLDEMLSGILDDKDFAEDVHNYHMDIAENCVDESPLRDAENLEIAVRHGVTFVEVINEAADRFDLIVKFSPERQSSGLSADDAHLIRKCPVPVWIIGGEDMADVERILVPMKLSADTADLKNLSRRLVHEAAILASAFNAKLHFLSVFNTSEADLLRYVGAGKLTEDSIARLRDDISRVYSNRLQAVADDVTQITRRLGLPIPAFELIQGDVIEAIPKAATSFDAEVVVMGTLGRLEVPGLLIGNTAEAVLPNIPCSLLAVKPNGFRSPVLEWMPASTTH